MKTPYQKLMQTVLQVDNKSFFLLSTVLNVLELENNKLNGINIITIDAEQYISLPDLYTLCSDRDMLQLAGLLVCHSLYAEL